MGQYALELNERSLERRIFRKVVRWQVLQRVQHARKPSGVTLQASVPERPQLEHNTV